MRNFFRELKNCEDVVLSEDATFTNLAGETEPYQESTKKTLCEVISIVSSGRFFRWDSPSYFIAKNFRLGPSSLAALWNEKHPDDRKVESTWRSQVYSVSQKFFKLFGGDFFQVFVSQDMAGIERIRNTLALLSIPELEFWELFFGEVDKYCEGYEGDNFNIAECEKELQFLRRILRCRLIPEMEALDGCKLQYLKWVLDTHFFHNNIIQMKNRPFHSVKEMNEALVRNWNARVSPSDEIYVLGDLTLKGPLLANELLRQLRGRKYLIRGNHDKFVDRQSFQKDAFLWVKDYFELSWQGQYFILCHYPLLSWNGMYRGSLHLHGHQHNPPEYNLANRAAGVRRIDVGVDAFGMAPVSIEEVLAFFGDEEK